MNRTVTQLLLLLQLQHEQIGEQGTYIQHLGPEW